MDFTIVEGKAPIGGYFAKEFYLMGDNIVFNKINSTKPIFYTLNWKNGEQNEVAIKIEGVSKNSISLNSVVRAYKSIIINLHGIKKQGLKIFLVLLDEKINQKNS